MYVGRAAHVGLGYPQEISHFQITAIVFFKRIIVEIDQKRFIGPGKCQPGSGEQGDGPAMLVEEHPFPGRYPGGIIKTAEFTGRGNKNREIVCVLPGLDIGHFQYPFMRPANLTAMSDIIHHQASFLHPLVDHPVDLRVPGSTGGGDHGISISVYLVDIILIVVCLQYPRQIFGVIDKQVTSFILVVADKCHDIAPVIFHTCILRTVTDRLIYGCRCFFRCIDREPADADIQHTIGVEAFIFIQQSEIVVGKERRYR